MKIKTILSEIRAVFNSSDRLLIFTPVVDSENYFIDTSGKEISKDEAEQLQYIDATGNVLSQAQYDELKDNTYVIQQPVGKPQTRLINDCASVWDKNPGLNFQLYWDKTFCPYEQGKQYYFEITLA